MKIISDDTYVYTWDIPTIEGRRMAFLYGFMDCSPEVAESINRQFPDYTKIENEHITLTKNAENKVSVDELVAMASLDDTEYCGVLDLQTKEVLIGDPDMILSHINDVLTGLENKSIKFSEVE